MNIRFQPNTLYYGDCLDILRDFPSDCVDLICLDPPFNSNANYHTIFRGSGLSIKPQIKAFDDMWLWDPDSEQRVREIKNAIANPASKVIAAFEMIIPQSPMLSYTSYMAQRLFEMHRVMKDTGSIYLHCDPTASHYLKLVLDGVFGEKNFRNEIVWHYFKPHSSKRTYPKNYDSILYYVKNKDAEYAFNFDAILVEYDTKAVKRYDRIDEDGRRYKIYNNKDGTIRRSYMKTGKPDNVFDIPFVQGTAKEKLGYPTQKPLSLYERIIKASSNEGDLVLDPFAGCGTTIEAALTNNRRVIGIDILPFALRLINQYRVRRSEYLPVQGVPVDKETAFQLAKDDPFKFQDWAISLIDGLAANPKKVGDEGIDGFGMFLHKPDNIDMKAILVQVTGAAGSQKVKFDKLQSDVRSHNAAMGILITRDAQTARQNWKVNLPSIKMGETTYDPMQCFSIGEYYRYGERYKPFLNLPALANPWTGKPMDTQVELDFDTEEDSR